MSDVEMLYLMIWQMLPITAMCLGGACVLVWAWEQVMGRLDDETV